MLPRCTFAGCVSVSSRRMLRLGVCGMWLLGSLPLAATTTVYQCSVAGGVLYQDTPCARGQQQKTLGLTDVPATPPSALLTHTAPAVEPAPVLVARPTRPNAPLPLMYGCIRATDGKSYISRRGDPAPYLAPFGMLGMFQQPLSQVYGQPGGAGISAPEMNRGRVTSQLISNNYVWVQDECRPLTMAETCHALRDAHDDNAQQLKNAFKSEQPPLEQRDAELRTQLDNC